MKKKVSFLQYFSPLQSEVLAYGFLLFLGDQYFIVTARLNIDRHCIVVWI